MGNQNTVRAREVKQMILYIFYNGQEHKSGQKLQLFKVDIQTGILDFE